MKNLILILLCAFAAWGTTRTITALDSTTVYTAMYDMRELNGAVDTGLTTVATYWGTTIPYVCKAIYNSSATAVEIRLATVNRPTPAAADTVRVKIDDYSCSPKLPAIAKIFKIGATDSLIAFLQVVYP